MIVIIIGNVIITIFVNKCEKQIQNKIVKKETEYVIYVSHSDILTEY